MEEKINEILALLPYIDNNNEKLRVISTLLKISNGEQQLLSLGFDVVETIDDGLERIQSLLSLAIAVKDADFELYKGLIQMTINEAEKLANPKQKAMALSDIAVEAVTFDENLAIKLVEEVLTLILKIDLKEDRTAAVMHFLKTLLRSEDIEGAIRVAEKISDPYYRAIAFSEIGKVLVEANIPLYSSIFSQALKSAAEIENPVTREMTFGEIISKLAEAGKVNESLKLAEKLKIKDARIQVVEAAFLKLIEIGKLSDASKLMRLIEDREKRARLKMLSVGALIKLGNYGEALRIVEGIRISAYKDIALSEMSVALAEKGEFKKAIQVARHIQDSYYRGGAFSLIGLELFNKGEDGYQLLFEKAIEEAKTIKSSQLRSRLFLDIALRLTAVNLREPLLEFLTRKTQNAEKSIKEGNLERAAREYKEGLELSEIARLMDYSEHLKDKIYKIRRKLVERIEVS
ncbi:hypothetical protein E3E31_05390 [Thermococcus sp. M39]|uniref:hypothetical protein n=1 Tax=Thermococcus sp. M39 TaxID=1638262 RepID=UPI00143AF1DA|nr:hypothetical protein [Thermococcus sp. M39]NJE07959.1 hypothetical protein [Thermococcus sp. M39]